MFRSNPGSNSETDYFLLPLTHCQSSVSDYVDEEQITLPEASDRSVDGKIWSEGLDVKVRWCAFEMRLLTTCSPIKW